MTSTCLPADHHLIGHSQLPLHAHVELYVSAGTAFLGDRAACVILLRYVVSQMQSFFTVKVDKLTAESSYTDQDWSTGRNNATDVAKIGLYIPAPAATTTSCVLWVCTKLFVT